MNPQAPDQHFTTGPDGKPVFIPPSKLTTQGVNQPSTPSLQIRTVSHKQVEEQLYTRISNILSWSNQSPPYSYRQIKEILLSVIRFIEMQWDPKKQLGIVIHSTVEEANTLRAANLPIRAYPFQPCDTPTGYCAFIISDYAPLTAGDVGYYLNSIYSRNDAHFLFVEEHFTDSKAKEKQKKRNNSSSSSSSSYRDDRNWAIVGIDCEATMESLIQEGKVDINSQSGPITVTISRLPDRKDTCFVVKFADLPLTVKEQTIRNICLHYMPTLLPTEIRFVHLVKDIDTRVPTGLAWVKLINEEAFNKAQNLINTSIIVFGTKAIVTAPEVPSSRITPNRNGEFTGPLDSHQVTYSPPAGAQWLHVPSSPAHSEDGMNQNTLPNTQTTSTNQTHFPTQVQTPTTPIIQPATGFAHLNQAPQTPASPYVAPNTTQQPLNTPNPNPTTVGSFNNAVYNVSKSTTPANYYPNYNFSSQLRTGHSFTPNNNPPTYYAYPPQVQPDNIQQPPDFVKAIFDELKMVHTQLTSDIKRLREEIFEAQELTAEARQERAAELEAQAQAQAQEAQIQDMAQPQPQMQAQPEAQVNAPPAINAPLVDNDANMADYQPEEDTASNSSVDAATGKKQKI